MLHSTATSCAAIRAKSWVPFAFRLVRALAVILDHTQLASDTKFANHMLEHAAEHSRTACLPWLNVIAHPAPCHSVIQAIASAAPTASGGRTVKLVCSCCCYAGEYALVCAFFLEQGPNPYFIDVVTGCASACMPSSQSLLAGNNVIACAYAGEFVAATDSMSMYLYRFGVCFGNYVSFRNLPTFPCCDFRFCSCRNRNMVLHIALFDAPSITAITIAGGNLAFGA